jgi:hypothetical protein
MLSDYTVYALYNRAISGVAGMLVLVTVARAKPQEAMQG